MLLPQLLTIRESLTHCLARQKYSFFVNYLNFHRHYSFYFVTLYSKLKNKDVSNHATKD